MAGFIAGAHKLYSVNIIHMEEMPIMEYVITFTWDDDAGVWIATSDDIPGLVLESGSFDALIERTRFAIPELLELNAAT
jgi:hypothetical protein